MKRVNRVCHRSGLIALACNGRLVALWERILLNNNRLCRYKIGENECLGYYFGNLLP